MPVETPRRPDGTGTGLLAFLEWAGRTGELNPTTAHALRSTSKTVLGIEPDGLETDLTNLDVNAVLNRFENLNRTHYSSGSMTTYRSRFHQAVAMYLAWLKKDPGWKSAGKASPARGTASPASTSRPRPTAKRPSSAKGSAPTSTAEASPVIGAPTTSARLVAYDVPLRPDLIIRMTLPIDLTANDAERVAAFVRSLAFTDTAAKPRPGQR